MLMLTLDDAVKVAMRYSDMDEEILRSEFEQKCWISSDKTNPKQELSEAICDINPKEIASHIENDSLGEWCEGLQAFMTMRLYRLKTV